MPFGHDHSHWGCGQSGGVEGNERATADPRSGRVVSSGRRRLGTMLVGMLTRRRNRTLQHHAPGSPAGGGTQFTAHQATRDGRDPLRGGRVAAGAVGWLPPATPAQGGRLVAAVGWRHRSRETRLRWHGVGEFDATCRSPYHSTRSGPSPSRIACIFLRIGPPRRRGVHGRLANGRSPLGRSMRDAISGHG